MAVDHWAVLMCSGRSDRSQPRRADDRAQAEGDEHERHAELEQVGHPRRHFRAQQHQRDADDDQRERVAEAPAQAEKRGAQRSALITDERGHGGEMIRLERVAHAEQCAERRSRGDLEEWHNRPGNYT